MKIKWIYIELTDLKLYEGQSTRIEIETLLAKGYLLQKSRNCYYDKSGDPNLLSIISISGLQIRK